MGTILTLSRATTSDIRPYPMAWKCGSLPLLARSNRGSPPGEPEKDFGGWRRGRQRRLQASEVSVSASRHFPERLSECEFSVVSRVEAQPRGCADLSHRRK